MVSDNLYYVGSEGLTTLIEKIGELHTKILEEAGTIAESNYKAILDRLDAIESEFGSYKASTDNRLTELETAIQNLVTSAQVKEEFNQKVGV